MSLRTLTEDAGLSLQEILNVSQDEFKGWSTVACKKDIISRAAVYREWRMLRKEVTHGAISSLRTLCDEAGLPMQEVLAMSKNDFRHLTRVMQVDSITQHTLLYQEKSRILDTLRCNEPDDTAAEHAGHLLVNITSSMKADDAWGHCEPNVHEQQFLADFRNDIDCREHAVSNSMMGGQQGLCDVRQDEAPLINEVASVQDENSLLNDVLMSSHNIDPNGNGQLSLEFVWQLANTQKQAVEHVPGNEVIFSGGRSKIGTRRYIKFVESFRSLFIISSESDRVTLAGLLVLVAQTRGYRFLKMESSGQLRSVGEEYARERTMEILFPQKGKTVPSAIVKYPRGQTRFTDEEDDIIFNTVMNSPEYLSGEPFTSWSRLAEKLPGYKSKQIRDRWVNNLNPKINHSQFSEEEDIKLYEALSVYGRKWAEISVAVFDSTRPENQVKNRRHSAAFRKFVIKKYGQEAFDAIETKTEAAAKRKSSSKGGGKKKAKADSEVRA
jgi:hypothetical protein